MSSAKNLLRALRTSLDSSETSRHTEAETAFRSAMRAQMSARNSKSRDEIGALYAELAKDPAMWSRLPGPQSAPTPFEPAQQITPGLSLLTCCMNRNDHVLQCIPTWLAHDEIDEIVIVDWTSVEPVAHSLKQAGIDDPRIRIIRVEDEGRWVLSHAYNLGFRAVTRSRVLKVDSDILLAADFFEKNTPADNTLIAGNWRNAAEGQSHVNGFFITDRAKLFEVNGFNERILTYGWDDDDIYGRLIAAGVRRVDVDPNSITHVDHDNSRRTDSAAPKIAFGWSQIAQSPMFWTNVNRIQSETAAPWSPTDSMIRFDVIESDTPTHVLRVRRHERFGVDPSLIGDRRTRIDAAIATLNHLYPGRSVSAPGPVIEKALSCKSLDDAMRVISFSTSPAAPAAPASPALLDRKPRLIIDAKYGLGNRLRAITSAAMLADLSERELIIRWQRDDHCDGDFHTLFDYDGPVDSSDDTPEGAEVIDLMDKSFRDHFVPDVYFDSRGDLLVKSAFRLGFQDYRGQNEDQMMRGLRPTAEILDMVNSVRNPNDISAHVRMAGGAALDTHGDVAGDWSKQEDDTTRRARDRSHYGYFLKRIDELAKEGRGSSIFLASDSAKAYEVFTERYGDKVSWLPRTVYDRSEMQLKYALADIILLSRSKILLGSGWSSFTEVAHGLANKQKIEFSGTDF